MLPHVNAQGWECGWGWTPGLDTEPSMQSSLTPIFCPRRPSSPGEPAAPFSPCRGNADSVGLELFLQDVCKGTSPSSMGFWLSSLLLPCPSVGCFLKDSTSYWTPNQA